MCDTNEHMMIGDQAASWIPQMLKKIYDTYDGKSAGGSINDYAPGNGGFTPADSIKDNANIFGAGPTGDSWFTNFQSGQFLLKAGSSDWASYGDILALSGDYYPSEQGMEQDADGAEKLINAWRAAIADPSKKMDSKGDPEFGKMVVRAMSNWPHFGHDAIDMWLNTHRQAIDLAIRGRKGTLSTPTADDKTDYMQDPSVAGMGMSQVVAGLLLALRHNAFGDHYLSDFFSAGHLRVQRKEFFNYLGPIDGSPGQAGTGAASEYGQLIHIPAKGLQYAGLSRAPDIASTISGIGHDEDGWMGLWCKTHFAPDGAKLNSIDGVGEVPGGSDRGSGVKWAAPLDTTASPITNFYARGDDGLGAPNNNVTRALCFYTIGLSIRDILYASVTGLDPQSGGSGFYGHTVQQPSNWWDAVGGKPSTPPLYAAMTLLPRPNDPDGSWTAESHKSSDVQNRTELDNWNGGSPGPNHFPIMKPDIGYSGYYDALKAHMSGSSFTKVSKVQIRSYPRRVWISLQIPEKGTGILDTIKKVGKSVEGTEVWGTVTAGCYSPQNEDRYFDFLQYLTTDGPDGTTKESWLRTEEAPMMARYAYVHGVVPSKDDAEKFVEQGAV